MLSTREIDISVVILFNFEKAELANKTREACFQIQNPEPSRPSKLFKFLLILVGSTPNYKLNQSFCYDDQKY